MFLQLATFLFIPIYPLTHVYSPIASSHTFVGYITSLIYDTVSGADPGNFSRGGPTLRILNNSILYKFA